MRRAARTDRNQSEVIKAFIACGCSVYDSSRCGGGFPDLVVSDLHWYGHIFRRITYLVEIKDGTKPPSARKLTPDQVKFRDSWKGLIIVVTDVVDVPGIVNQMRR